mmetsp:Transcript_6154/g.24931  ORF Transcript_6154/g.24931 Transcript_6154/m.24931 type:complete len:217 (-) Transcript_6154:1077-1727(-)
MDSFIRVPPRSLHPALSSAPAIAGPILTQDAWMLTSPADPSVTRAAACTSTHSRSVGPRRVSPRKYAGASKCTNGSGTNSVNPPTYASPRGARLFSHTSEPASVVSRRFRLASLHTERKCASRIATRCAARASIVSSSTCPNIIVAVVGTSASCAASTVASHCFESSLSGHRLCRTSSDRTSAAVPGSDPNPFAFKISMNFGTEPFKEPSSYVSAP